MASIRELFPTAAGFLSKALNFSDLADAAAARLNLGVGGAFKGENGERNAAASGDIFRVHEQTLNTDTTIDGDENAIACGPLAVASGTTLTVASGGVLKIV